MKAVCVYCGSSHGNREAYVAAARELAGELVRRNLRLVYGGASVGLMGELADRVLALGGEVIGVIPEALVRKEVAHRNLTRLHVTASMHERKTLMAELADAFIALPGGIGTLEELFEVWTWAQLGLHRKACGLLNVAGYFDELLRFLDQTVTAGFVKAEQRSLLQVAPTAAPLLDILGSWVAPAAARLLAPEES